MDYLIPQEWFDQSHSGLLVLYAILGLYFLQLGAEWLVGGATELAFRLGMPEMVVGATIVSLGTTTPECAVSVMAAIDGNSGLALGNAVGSVIADTALIFGLGCLLAHLPADRFILNRQGWVQFGAGLLLAVLCYSLWFLQGEAAAIGRTAGLCFLGLLALYMAISVRWARMHPDNLLPGVSESAEPKSDTPPADAASTDSTPGARGVTRILWTMLIGLVVIVVSGHFTISSVTVLAERVGVPQVVIAATLIAFGTSLPELVVGLTAIRRGHPELLVGNIIGADILNILFVTGAAATASPLPVIDQTARLPEIFLVVHLPAMLLILTFFRFCIFRAIRRGHFERWMGPPLLVMYVTYVISQYALSL